MPHPLNDPTEFGSLGDLHGISRKEGWGLDYCVVLREADEMMRGQMEEMVQYELLFHVTFIIFIVILEGYACCKQLVRNSTSTAMKKGKTCMLIFHNKGAMDSSIT